MQNSVMAFSAALHPPFRNALLAGLPEDELAQVRPVLTRLCLVPRQVLIDYRQVTEHVFFMEDGIVSLVAEAVQGRAAVQVAMIGREGMVGSQALLGRDNGAFVASVIQIPGPAHRLPIDELRRLARQCPVLAESCLAAAEALMRQTMETAACNARNTVAERLVRWLLMAHDRVEGDELGITHEALSNVLGVRRSGVTIVASSLQGMGLVRVNRGRITILDRAGLERQAGGLFQSAGEGVAGQPHSRGAGGWETARLAATG